MSVLCPGATDTPGKDHFDVDYDKLPIKWMNVSKVVKAGPKLAGQAADYYPGNQESFFQLPWFRIVYAQTCSVFDEGSLRKITEEGKVKSDATTIARIGESFCKTTLFLETS